MDYDIEESWERLGEVFGEDEVDEQMPQLAQLGPYIRKMNELLDAEMDGTWRRFAALELD